MSLAIGCETGGLQRSSAMSRCSFGSGPKIIRKSARIGLPLTFCFRRRCSALYPKDLPITFASVEKLAAIFKMSLSATAIRLVEYGSYPAMLICNSPPGANGMWQARRSTESSGQSIALASRRWQPPFQGRPQSGPQDKRADQWIKNFRADQYWVKEDSKHGPTRVFFR